MGASKDFWTKPDDVRSSAFQQRKFAIANAAFRPDHNKDFTHICEF
jgi:hypothetical protein